MTCVSQARRPLLVLQMTMTNNQPTPLSPPLSLSLIRRQTHGPTDDAKQGEEHVDNALLLGSRREPAVVGELEQQITDRGHTRLCRGKAIFEE